MTPPFARIRAALRVLSFCALVAAPAVAAPIKVLIVDGFSNHDWKRNTRMIRAILESTGLFAVSVSTSPPTAAAPGWDTWRPSFSAHDVVIQTCNDIRNGIAWPVEVQRDFERYVREGGGVYVYHSGNNAFKGWPEYNAMLAIGWRDAAFGPAVSLDDSGAVKRIPAGDGPGTGHGPRSTVLIRRRGDHPIHAGFPREWLTPDLEIYYYARGPAENLDVISYAFDARTRMNWPIEWVVSYGRGRVYTSTFGHVMAAPPNPESMRCAGHQTLMIRALQWLAGRTPDFAVPSDFPSAERTSVRGDLEPAP